MEATLDIALAPVVADGNTVTKGLAGAAVSSPVCGFMAISVCSFRCSVCDSVWGLPVVVCAGIASPVGSRSPGPASYRRKKRWSPPNCTQFAKTGILRPFSDESGVGWIRYFCEGDDRSPLAYKMNIFNDENIQLLIASAITATR